MRDQQYARDAQVRIAKTFEKYNSTTRRIQTGIDSSARARIGQSVGRDRNNHLRRSAIDSILPKFLSSFEQLRRKLAACEEMP